MSASCKRARPSPTPSLSPLFNLCGIEIAANPVSLRSSIPIQESPDSANAIERVVFLMRQRREKLHCDACCRLC